MIEISWYEFNGRKKRPPKNLIYRESGGLDLRYKVNKEFIADKRWVYRSPIAEIWLPEMVASIAESSILAERLLGSKKGTRDKAVEDNKSLL